MNVILNNGSSAEYAALVKEMKQMSESEWDSYDFYGADKEIFARMRKKDNPLFKIREQKSCGKVFKQTLEVMR